MSWSVGKRAWPSKAVRMGMMIGGMIGGMRTWINVARRMCVLRRIEIRSWDWVRVEEVGVERR